MTISDDLKMYLQERRRMLLSEVASIERIMGIDKGADDGRRRFMQDMPILDGPRVADSIEGMRRG